MTLKIQTVAAYIARLQELGEQDDHIGRFYLALNDEELLDLEEQLNQTGEGLTLYQPVLALYNRWKAEMGPVKWAEAWAYNESLSDADRNWLVSEAMNESADLLSDAPISR